MTPASSPRSARSPRSWPTLKVAAPAVGHDDSHGTKDLAGLLTVAARGRGFAHINGPPVPDSECVLAQGSINVSCSGGNDQRFGHYVDRGMRRITAAWC